VINTGSIVGTSCQISPVTQVAATFFYQTTNGATNAVTGSPNTPIDIPPGAVQSFVFGFTPTGAFAPTDINLSFKCSNTSAAPVFPGVNTLLLSASTSGVPDVIAIAATTSNDGIAHVPGASSIGFFSTAGVNIGTASTLEVSPVVLGGAEVQATVCETNPATAACYAPPASSVSSSFSTSIVHTFTVFLIGQGNLVTPDFASKRIRLEFKDSSGNVRGATGVAVCTIGAQGCDPEPIVSLVANPTNISSGATSVLNWGAANATSCIASGGWSGARATSGSQTTVAITASTTFSLTCSGPGGSVTVSTAVNVVSPMPDYTVETVAGNGITNLGDGGPATLATLVAPERVLASSSGVVYVADTNNNRVASVDANGNIRTFAGRISAEHQPLGDGGPATDAVVRFPRGLYETTSGLYIGDHSYTVRLVDANGLITNAAITDRAASILPWAVAVDGAGRVYIADTFHHKILRTELNGSLTVIAGTGIAGTSGDNGPAVQAQIDGPIELRFDGPDNLLIGFRSAPLRQVSLTTGGITTRLPNLIGYFDIDGTGAFVATKGNRVVRINPVNGAEMVVAGTGAPGFGGDGGPAAAALFNDPRGVSLDATGNIFVADSGNNRVRKITPAGVITTLAGGGHSPAQLTGVPDSQGLGFDRDGRLFFTDFQYHYLRRVLPDGTSKVVAGKGIQTTSGDGGPAKDAAFANPSMITFDSLGRLIFLDLNYGTGAVRMIEPGADGVVDGGADETITTIAGRNVDRAQADHGSADGGPARNAVFDAARDFVMDSHGNLIITDWYDNRIRKVVPGADGVFNGGGDEIITTIAGNGTAGQTGDGGLATNASLEAPTRIAIDANDNIYVFVGNNTGHTAIRRIDATSRIITTLTTGLDVVDMIVDRAGKLFYAAGAQVVQVDTVTGARTVIAGVAQRGFAGDGGDALLAVFRAPSYFAVDASDNIYLVDNGNFRIRRLVKKH
jgi:hypothetical protein